MARLFWLSEHHLERIQIIHVLRHSLRCVAAGRLTSKRHGGGCRKKARPVRLHLSEGQWSDFTGADVLLRDLPPAKALNGGQGDDSNTVRTLLLEQGIPPGRKRNKRVPSSKRL